jgi:hypothetical protein
MTDQPSSDEQKQLVLKHLEYLAKIAPAGKGAYTSVGLIRRYIADSTPGAPAVPEDPTLGPGY